jgi:hypothetical protein
MENKNNNFNNQPVNNFSSGQAPIQNNPVPNGPNPNPVSNSEIFNSNFSNPQTNVNQVPPNPNPTSLPTSSFQPTISTNFNNTVPNQPNMDKPKKKKGKKFLVGGLVSFVILIALGLGFYFLYWLNPNIIWSRSLTGLSFAYSKLANYSLNQTTTTYKGFNLTGSLTAHLFQDDYTGNLNIKTSGKNTNSIINFGLGSGNIAVKELSINQPGSTFPDLYLNVAGFKNYNVGNIIGLDNTKLNSLDGQWIEINHSLLDQIEKSQLSTLQSSSSSSGKLTAKLVSQAAVSIEGINNKYLFTTNKNNAVFKIIKSYGFVTLDNHKTYHYKIGFNKNNVKSYIFALSNQLSTTDLGHYIANASGSSFDQAIDLNGLRSSADNITDADSADVWVDANSGFIYKVQYSDSSNPVNNYVNVGLSYKSLSEFPFYINFSSDNSGSQTTINALVTINTKTNNISGKINYTTSSSGSNNKVNVTGNFKQTNDTLNITPPTNSITLEQALDRIGLGSEYNQVINGLKSSSLLQASTLPISSTQI